MKVMLVDVPNLFWRVVSATSKKFDGNPEEKAALALHSCIMTMNKWFNVVKPDQVIVVFEGNNNWRKAYTSSPKCVSKRLYKGNRVRDPSMAHLFEVLSDFEKLARAHTSIVCLSASEVEGDDLIAGCTKRFSNQGDEVTIVSGDKDFMQLLKHPRVTLLNPDNGKPRLHDDPHFFMFEKCFRGDLGDNVPSAYPRVRIQRLQKAFKDDYERTQIMNETWTFTHPDTKEEILFNVGELYEENKILMDLEAQPDYIQEIIESTIEHGLNTHGKFSLFAFSKFLGQHELKDIALNIDRYVKLLSCVPKAPLTQQGILKF